jgi:hypothetical protein
VGPASFTAWDGALLAVLALGAGVAASRLNINTGDRMRGVAGTRTLRKRHALSGLGRVLASVSATAWSEA